MKVPCPQCLSNVTLLDAATAPEERVRWQTLRLSDHNARTAPGVAPVACTGSGERYADVVAAQPHEE